MIILQRKSVLRRTCLYHNLASATHLQLIVDLWLEQIRHTASLALVRRVEHHGPDESLGALCHCRLVPTIDILVVLRLVHVHRLGCSYFSLHASRLQKGPFFV